MNSTHSIALDVRFAHPTTHIRVNTQSESLDKEAAVKRDIIEVDRL